VPKGGGEKREKRFREKRSLFLSLVEKKMKRKGGEVGRKNFRSTPWCRTPGRGPTGGEKLSFAGVGFPGGKGPIKKKGKTSAGRGLGNP